MQISGLSPVQTWSFDDHFDFAKAQDLESGGAQSRDGVDPPHNPDDDIFYSKSEAPKKNDPPKVVRVECPPGTVPTVTPTTGNAVEVECKKPPKTAPSGAPVLE